MSTRDERDRRRRKVFNSLTDLANCVHELPDPFVGELLTPGHAHSDDTPTVLIIHDDEEQQ